MKETTSRRSAGRESRYSATVWRLLLAISRNVQSTKCQIIIRIGQERTRTICIVFAHKQADRRDTHRLGQIHSLRMQLTANPRVRKIATRLLTFLTRRIRGNHDVSHDTPGGARSTVHVPARGPGEWS